MDLILKLISFIANFNAVEYFLVDRRNLVLYDIFSFYIGWEMIMYLGSIYDLKKSSKKKKYIAKEYPIYKRIFLIHWYENVYKKVDRFWFDLAYICFFVHLITFLIVTILPYLCKYYIDANLITAILYVVHVAYMLVILIVLILGSRFSPFGGVEFRDAKKYRRKNW